MLQTAWGKKRLLSSEYSMMCAVVQECPLPLAASRSALVCLAIIIRRAGYRTVGCLHCSAGCPLFPMHQWWEAPGQVRNCRPA